MFKRNQLYVSLFATSMLLGSVSVMAQETAPGDATVTVQNTFDIAQVSGIDFGTVRATVDSDATDDAGSVHVSTLPLDTQGAHGTITTAGGATTTSSITVLATGAAGEFAITNAAPFTAINITAPAAFDLVNGSGSPTTAVFGVGTFTFRETGAVADGTAVTTDINGEINFTMGASLSTDDNAATRTNYIDGAYTGTFTLQVAY
ncbi:DUF4402 domain-containing protein [Agaribacter marinus]|uniref:DUF4402 domain-containing protein n=1 Tax=Agaribacter marinus TaxID=1431249 RepID=A0AA37WJU7_9ALTE|nr:DUF4402 domain-containing protein [Agaribacter marinus]GLR70669.1 hypothetical protein GCM10007852_15770 [Agaribacter marinus]